MIGAIDESSLPADTVPGAIDAQLTFALLDLTAQPETLDFGEQPIGTASAAQTVSLTTTSGEEVPVHWVDVDGGAQQDFLLSSRCESTQGGSPCDIEVRFAPTETGPRTTDLVARITNPITDERETVRLGELSGIGTPGTVNPPGTSPLAPVIIARRAAKVGPTGRAKVARLRCPDGLCEARRTSARLWIDGRRAEIELKAPARVRKGKATRARVILGTQANRRLKRIGKGIAIARIAIKSSNGERTVKRFAVTLRPR